MRFEQDDGIQIYWAVGGVREEQFFTPKSTVYTEETEPLIDVISNFASAKSS